MDSGNGNLTAAEREAKACPECARLNAQLSEAKRQYQSCLSEYHEQREAKDRVLAKVTELEEQCRQAWQQTLSDGSAAARTVLEREATIAKVTAERDQAIHERDEAREELAGLRAACDRQALRLRVIRAAIEG